MIILEILRNFVGENIGDDFSFHHSVGKDIQKFSTLFLPSSKLTCPQGQGPLQKLFHSSLARYLKGEICEFVPSKQGFLRFLGVGIVRN